MVGTDLCVLELGRIAVWFSSLVIEDFSISIYLQRTLIVMYGWRDRGRFQVGGERVEFSINVKQGIAVIWTIIALIISLIIVLAMGWPTYATYGSFSQQHGNGSSCCSSDYS